MTAPGNLSRRARNDLSGILERSTATFGIAQAERLEGEILRRCHEIAAGRELGHIRPDMPLKRMLRFWPVPPFVIVYCPRTLLVIRILHGRRDIPASWTGAAPDDPRPRPLIHAPFDRVGLGLGRAATARAGPVVDCAPPSISPARPARATSSALRPEQRRPDCRDRWAPSRGWRSTNSHRLFRRRLGPFAVRRQGPRYPGAHDAVSVGWPRGDGRRSRLRRGAGSSCCGPRPRWVALPVDRVPMAVQCPATSSEAPASAANCTAQAMR